jgi:hypothetical protein
MVTGESSAAKPPTCLATPVHTAGGSSVVRSGPISGALSGDYDIVKGRFSLHVGPWRVKNSLTQKIPWFVRDDAPAGPELVVSGLRLTPQPHLRFEQTFPAALDPADVYPSTISPPGVGCWRLTLRTGEVNVQLTALVRK